MLCERERILQKIAVAIGVFMRKLWFLWMGLVVLLAACGSDGAGDEATVQSITGPAFVYFYTDG